MVNNIISSDRVFIIAEISANHGHDIDIVKKTILKAKEIGCDAVKMQTFLPQTMTLDCDTDYFKLDSTSIWYGRTLFDLYSEGYLPWEWHEELFDFARQNDILLFSTPFDFSAVDLLEKCDNPIYKIASFEANDIPLVRYAAKKNKPMIISAGLSTEEEMRNAVEACRMEGNDDIYLLKCTSQYPAKISDANLKTMVDMGERFNVNYGLSDHTEGSVVAVAAAALGARVIEKHIILDKNIDSPDASFSMKPDEFESMIRQIRDVESALGTVDYELTEAKILNRKYIRSIFISNDVKAGDIVSEKNIKSVRPSDGLDPCYYFDVLGKTFIKDQKKGTPLKLEMLK